MELIKKGTKILCLSPHPDDVEFGLGATINKHKEDFEGRLIVFSDRSATRGEKHNCRDQLRAAKTIGLKEENVKFIDQLNLNVERLPIRFFGTEENRDLIRMVVSRVVKEFEPDIVFVPSLRETMQDHKAIAEEVVRVVRGKISILGYEVPKHNRHFTPNVFVDITEEHLKAKVKALAAFSEFDNTYYFQEDGIKSMARMKALQAGYCGYAEAFELYQLFSG